MARLLVAVPTGEAGSGEDFFELRKSLWEGIVGKAREYLQVLEEANRK